MKSHIPGSRLHIPAREKREKSLVRSFLRYRGYSYRELKTVHEYWREGQKPNGPDLKLTLLDSGHSRIGIELTEYQVDRGIGKSGSISQRHLDAWVKIHRLIRRNYVGRWYPHLKNVDVHIEMKSTDFPSSHNMEMLREFAREIVDFVHNNTPSNMKTFVTFEGCNQCTGRNDFLGYSCLTKFVSSLSLFRTSAVYCYWHCGSPCHVGIDIQLIEKTIFEKRKALYNYSTSDIQECWLLICASGATTAARAGPEHFARYLDDNNLVDAARNSGYEKVIFWEKIQKWDREISGNESLSIRSDSH